MPVWNRVATVKNVQLSWRHWPWTQITNLCSKLECKNRPYSSFTESENDHIANKFLLALQSLLKNQRLCALNSVNSVKKSSVAEEGVLKLAIYYKSYQLAANTKSAYQIVFWSSSHSHGDLFTLFLDKNLLRYTRPRPLRYIFQGLQVSQLAYFTAYLSTDFSQSLWASFCPKCESLGDKSQPIPLFLLIHLINYWNRQKQQSHNFIFNFVCFWEYDCVNKEFPSTISARIGDFLGQMSKMH